MYRPKGWKNPYYMEDIGIGFYNKYPEFGVYEAGADAMLRALEKQPVPCDIQNALRRAQIDGLIDWGRPNGRVVFIPDKEVGKDVDVSRT